MNRRILSILLVPAFAIGAAIYSGCLANPTMTAAVKDYMPVAVGNYWCYDWIDYSGVSPVTSYQRWLVQTEEVKDGQSAFKVEKRYSISACPTSGASFNEYWFDNDSDFQINQTAYTDCKWVTYFKYPPVENVAWTSNCASSGTTKFDFKTRARESVTLNYDNHTYPNCGHVELTQTDTSGSIVTTYLYATWYAPGIGAIKMEKTDKTGNSATFNKVIARGELISTNVTGK